MNHIVQHDAELHADKTSWVTGNGSTVIHNPARGVRVDHITWVTPNGDPIYDQVILPEGSGVVCIIRDADGNFGLRLEDRVTASDQAGYNDAWKKGKDITPFLGSKLWGFPRGFAKSQEDVSAEAAARRLAGEEVGATFTAVTSVSQIGQTVPNSTFTPQVTYVFEVTVNRSQLGDPSRKDANAGILKGVEWFTGSELVDMLVSGQVFCGFTQSAFLLYLLKSGTVSVS